MGKENLFSSGTCFCNCSKLKFSSAPVSAFSIIPIVPPVYISRTEVFSGAIRTFLSLFACKDSDIS